MPAFSLPTNLNSIEAWIGGLYGYAVGSQTMTQINADITSYGSLGSTLNTYYTSAFGSLPTATVAANIVANVGLGTDANAIAYVTGQLNAVSANARGVAVLNVLNAFSGLTADKTYGAAATAWNATVANSVTYAAQNTGDAALADAAKAVAKVAAAPVTAALTTAIDNVTGNAVGNNTINGADVVVGTSTQPTFTAGDTIALTGTGNVLNWITSAAIASSPAGATVSGVQTANVNSTGGAALILDVTKGWTGLTQLNVTNSANAATAATGDSVTVTAPATTNINATSGNTLTAGGITTLGGLGVTATLVNAGANAGVAVNIGTLIQPAGNAPVVVSDSEAIVGATNATTYTAGGITTFGGSTVTVTQNIAPDSASASTLAGSASTALSKDNGGAIKINGTATTTSVTVTQTPQNGAVAGNAAATGFTGVAGIVDGAVTVTDINATGSKAGTITSVSLTNFGGTVGTPSVITSNALNSLTLAATSTSSPVGVPAAGANVGQIGGSYGTATAAFAQNTPGYSLSASQSVTSNGYLSVVNPLATTPVTALTLNLAGGSGNLITFSGAGMANVSTLNIVTSAATSTAPITGGQFKTINVSGSGVATLGAATTASSGGNNGFNASANSGLTALNVSGAAGFSDGNGAGSRSGLNTFGSLLTITNTGTGKFTAYIDSTTQSYVAGAAGTSTITVNADALKPITGGAGTADEIIFAAAPTLTAAGSGTNISGFEIFGVGVGATGGTFDMSKFTNDSFTTIDVAASSSSGTYTFNKVTGNTLNIGTSSTNTAAAGNTITYTVADATGPQDNLTINIGSTSATTGTVFNNTNTLTLNDASGQGIGNLVINTNVSTATGTSTAINDTLALTDVGLTSLTINGGAGLTITGNQTISSASLTIVDNSTAANADGSTWTDGFTGSITDTILSNISYTGSHNFSIGNIATSSPVLNVTNSNTGTTGVLALGTVTDTNLVSISLKGSVSGTFAPTVAAGNSFTLSGATDNSNVSVTLTNGAGATLSDNITLGNGNNTIIDPSAAGTVNITAGTGTNAITVGGTSNTTGSYNVTVGYHTAADTFTVGNGGTFVTSAPNTIINGALSGDFIVLNNDNTAPVSATNVSGAPNISAAISAIETTTAQAAYAAFVPSAGVTLIAENKNTTVTGANETLIQVSGKQNISWFGLGFAPNTAKDVIALNATTNGVTVPAPTVAGNSTVALATHTTSDTITAGAVGIPTATAFNESVIGYVKATDIIKATNLILGVQTAAAGAGVATITAGVATFNGADTTAAAHLAAVAAAQQATAGATTLWQEGADTWVFISDGILAVGAADILIKLVGVTAGAPTIASNSITAIA